MNGGGPRASETSSMIVKLPALVTITSRVPRVVISVIVLSAIHVCCLKVFAVQIHKVGRKGEKGGTVF